MPKPFPVRLLRVAFVGKDSKHIWAWAVVRKTGKTVKMRWWRLR